MSRARTRGAKARNALVVDAAGDREKVLEQACAVLRRGELVAFPTESFYGLAADVRCEEAVRRLFAAKGRSPDRPVLLLIPSRESVVEYATSVPRVAHVLMDRFWPGPLTLVLEAGPNVSPTLTAGTGTIGLRLSSHPLATDLARHLGAAVTGTSANPSGRPPACTASEVATALGNEVAVVLDGGPTRGGAGSTILDMTVDPPRILRQGQISQGTLSAGLNRVVQA